MCTILKLNFQSVQTLKYSSHIKLFKSVASEVLRQVSQFWLVSFWLIPGCSMLKNIINLDQVPLECAEVICSQIPEAP